jgi:biotin carboxyl carrier protein
MSGDSTLRRIRPGLYSVIRDGRSYEIAVDLAASDEEGGGGDDVRGTATVDGRRVPIHIEDRRRRILAGKAAGAGATGHGPITVAAPMPGRIVALPAPVGTTVERGQTVVVLEAMKMESALAAPAAGTVSEVLVEPGQAVQQRQPLLRIDRGVSGATTGTS